MKDLPLRRGQLVTTFGPGSLVISPEGESALIGSLDKWFHDKYDNPIETLDEFEIQEPKLRSILKTEKLLMPPDFRPGYKYKNTARALTQTNTDIYIPLLRFPSWHYCPVCKNLYQLDMTNRTSWLDCNKCKKTRKMIQVPFVIVCSAGHISDFPWREWVHKNDETTCNGQLSLVTSGGATLDSLKVRCNCGVQDRSLKGVMTRNAHTSENEDQVSQLSNMLNIDKKLYQCPGHKPWYGSLNSKENCDSYPVAEFKNSINVYYPNTISSIYLPGGNPAVEQIIEMFELNGVTSSWLNVTDKLENKIELVKKLCPPEISEFKNHDIELAILYITGSLGNEEQTQDKLNTNSREMDLRNKEYEKLTDEVDTPNLKVRKEWNARDEKYQLSNYFNVLNRVTKLKETIALIGFNRLNDNGNNNNITLEQGKKLLFQEPQLSKNNWLPAYKVYGEGIFFTLNFKSLSEWENRQDVKGYFNKFLTRIEAQDRPIDESAINPRNVLIHTLSHVILEELALTCGYNSTSMRERLYIGNDYNGVLIYTSSGDIEGTFGGLVRMGKKENFFSVVYKAIDKARWCSSDPVCSEIGKTSGQGFNNLNGAACHSCSYLPETSCEFGNLFLDRTLLIDPEIGFFNM